MAGATGVMMPRYPLDAAITDAAARVLSERSGRPVTRSALQVEQLRRGARVCRVRERGPGSTGSLIVKRLPLARAERVTQVVRRWLPALHLGHVPPALLGAVAPSGEEWVWHFYEDVGAVTVQARQTDPRCIEAAVAVVVDLHVRAAGHLLVPEWRDAGQDFGMRYFLTRVADARRLLDDLMLPSQRASREQARVRERLRRHVDALLEDIPRRTRIGQEAGGPETMLHGDLWTTNMAVVERGDELLVRLIDWDHAGAGPVAYDLSTLLLRFPPTARRAVLDLYRARVERAGWRLAAVSELNVLFDTAECARCAGRIVECAIALLHDQAGWANEMLAEVLRWFEALRPVVPEA